MGKPAINHLAIAMLGLVTISAYGSWYYAFGVLFDPIRLDTGWNEATLASSFSLGTIAVGLGSIPGGRLLDRLGGRTVLIVGGIGGSAMLLVTSYSQNLIVFTVSSALGLGFLGSFGFYHATMTMAVRANPSDPAKAIAMLTIWGAFASAIYLPMTAELLDRYEWRVTVRIISLIAFVIFLVTAASVRTEGRQVDGGHDDDGPDDPVVVPLRQVLAATVATPSRRAFTVAVALGGVAMSTVLVYQVPVMTAAGLPLATAATLAGIRGFAQTGGRVPLGPIVRRLGSSGALVLAFASMAVGGAILGFSGTVPLALGFAIITGFGIGAFSPLQGIIAAELFERDALGATMGSYSMVLMVAGASGPALAGVLADTTGERRVVVLVVVVAATGAMISALRLLAKPMEER